MVYEINMIQVLQINLIEKILIKEYYILSQFKLIWSSK